MSAPGALIIFGATGDLARRMLFPSLYFLDLDGLLPSPLRIIGAARSALSDKAFRAEVETWVRERAGEAFSAAAWTAFAQRLSYVGGEAAAPGTYAALKQAIAGSGSGPDAAWRPQG
jgi:glucose-6-phosphate 1-dehydrogenase